MKFIVIVIIENIMILSLDILSFWRIVLLLNALFGVLLFEWAWAKMSRFRNPDKDIHEMFPAFRRNDAPKW